MSRDEFQKIIDDLDCLFYEFEHLQNRHEDKRELRVFFSRLKRDVKRVNEDIKNDKKTND